MRKENREVEKPSDFREKLVYQTIRIENSRRRLPKVKPKVQADRRENPKRYHLRQVQTFTLANHITGKTEKQRTHVPIRRRRHLRVFCSERHRPEEKRPVTLKKRFRNANERAKRKTRVTLATVKVRGVGFKTLRKN